MSVATDPEWHREKPRRFWDPGRKLLVSIRLYQKYRKDSNVLSPFMCKFALLRYRFWTVITGADIPVNINLGGGLMIPHPNGIVIHPDTVIGPNCLFFQQVTIGSRDSKPPVIGGHVDIGAGAKVLGDITIGNDVRIGANAVVLTDVPEGCTVAGIPARIIRKSE